VESLRINPRSLCERYFSADRLGGRAQQIKFRQQLPKGFTTEVACAGNELRPDGACEGDSGSPLFRLVSNTGRQEPYYEQRFIVSNGVSCDWPATFFIRVSDRKVLTWIQEMTGKMD